MGEVSVICKRTLVSTKTAKPGLKIPLSPLDLLMENHNIKMVYYYATPKGMMELGEMTSRLRTSLSEMLFYFPTVTSRLVRNEEDGKWETKCNDAGVRMVEARASGSVESWLHGLDEEKEKRLVHWEDVFHAQYYWATFYFKVTEFEEGGLAVGLSCTHLIADPLSATHFMKAWADRTLWGKTLIPPLIHPLPQQRLLGHKNLQHRPNTNLINHYKSILESPSPYIASKSKTVVLSFSDQTVQACMDSAQSNGRVDGSTVSPFTALAGLLWACITRAKGETNGLMEMSICMDVRKILGLDKGFFGNCMVYDKVHGDGIGVDDFTQATRAIGETIENVDYKGVMDLIKWLELSENPLKSPSVGIDDLIFINLKDMNPYSTVFLKNCEPVKVSYYIDPVSNKGEVLVLPPHSCQGRLNWVVKVTLPNDEVDKLCEDKLLAQFSPSILMGAKVYNA